MDPIVEDASGSIRDFELHRLHYTYSMIDLGTFKEDYRYVYRNGGNHAHRIVPLLWRWREVQANMYVLDQSNSNLIYLPSEVNRMATQRCLEKLLDEGHQAVPEAADGFVEARASLSGALGFESSESERTDAFNRMQSLARSNTEVAQFNRATKMVALLSAFYLPLALLPQPIEPGEFSFIRHGVDIYTPVRKRRRIGWSHLEAPPLRLRDLVRFLFVGRIHFRVPLALDALTLSGTKSFHCRVVVPPGLRVGREPSFDPEAAFEKAEPSRLVSYDESNVYLYLGAKELGLIETGRSEVGRKRQEFETSAQAGLRRLRRQFPRIKLPAWFAQGTKESFRRRLEEAGKVRPDVKVPLKIASGMTSLILLLWFLAIATTIEAARGLLDLDRFLAMLGLLLVVVISIGVFAIDKRILREFVSAHIISAVVMTAESYLLSVRF